MMVIPANLPQKFRDAAHEFANGLQACFASSLPAQPEDQLKAPVQALLKAVFDGVLTKTEAQVYDLGGRPDIGVHRKGTLCGFVELKAPGLGAQTKKFNRPWPPADLFRSDRAFWDFPKAQSQRSWIGT